MATKKAAKKKAKKKTVTKGKVKAPTKAKAGRATKALAETLVRLTSQHRNMLVSDGDDVIKGAGEVYPLVKQKGHGIRWFQQVEVVESRGESRSYTALVLEVGRPADASKRLALLRASAKTEAKSKDWEAGQRAMARSGSFGKFKGAAVVSAKPLSNPTGWESSDSVPPINAGETPIPIDPINLDDLNF